MTDTNETKTTRRGRAVHEQKQWTTHSKVGDEYEVGETLQLAEYVDYMRELHDAAHDVATELTDDEIANEIKSVAGDSAKAEASRLERIVAATTGEEEEVEDVSVAAARSEGFGLGARFDAQAIEHMQAVADAKEVQDGSALLIALDMQRLFKPEERAAWPVMGSSWDDDERVLAAAEGRVLNTPPDHYKAGKVRGSFVADMFDGTLFGKYVNDVRVALATIADNQELNEAQADLIRNIGYSQWRVLKDAELLDSERKRWNNKRSNMVTRFRRSVTYLQHEEQMTDAIDGIAVQMVQKPIMLADGRVDPMSPILRKANCLKVTWVGTIDGKRHVSNSDAMSISKFNRLLIGDVTDDTTKKVKRGALYYMTPAGGNLDAIAALEKTVEKPPRRRGSVALGLSIPVANVNGKQAYSMIAGLNSFFQDGRKDPKILLSLTEELGGKNSKADIKSLGDLIDELDTYFEPYKKAYDDIVQEELKLAQEETARRIAATGSAKK